MKPNYCRKGFEVSKVKFKLVFRSCEVYHKGKHKLLNQEVMMLFGSLHETLVPLFSRDNGVAISSRRLLKRAKLNFIFILTCLLMLLSMVIQETNALIALCEIC